LREREIRLDCAMNEDFRGPTGGEEVGWRCGDAEDVSWMGLIEGVEGEVLF
jgi:hypothetical protein